MLWPISHLFLFVPTRVPPVESISELLFCGRLILVAMPLVKMCSMRQAWQSITKFLQEHSDVFQKGETRRDPDDPNVSEYTISKVDSQVRR